MNELTGKPGGTPTILIIGGGLTGLQAAHYLADEQVSTIVVEQGPIVGGKRASWRSGLNQADESLVDVTTNAAIEIITQAEVDVLTGEAGAFSASITQLPRYVTQDCTRCNRCVPVCPEVVSNEFDAGLTFRKAIHSPLPDAYPSAYVIDIDSCLNVPPNYLPCQRCVSVCDDNAIHFDMPGSNTVERQVAAIIVATGFDSESSQEPGALVEFGYGRHPDIVSSTELQRLLEDPGPSGGFAVKPSDESYPGSALLILTHLSANASWILSNQLRQLSEQDVDQLTVLVLAAPGDYQELVALRDTIADCDAQLCWGSWIDVETAEEGVLRVRYAKLPEGSASEHCTDLVVLSSEVQPAADVTKLASILGLALSEQGYLSPSRDGIYVVGGALGTVGIEAGAAQAQQVVAAILPGIEKPVTVDTGPPGWTELPEHLQRQFLEDMLRSLVQLGEDPT